MNNGPNLWGAILKQMPPGSVIAGGAIRDWYLDVEPKDIDVFTGGQIPPDDPPTQECFFTEAFNPRSGLYRIDNYYERQEEYQAMGNIQLVSSGQMLGYRVDLVEMTDFTGGDDLIEGFDFAMNQMWFDGDLVYRNNAAVQDLANHTVTLLRDDRLERSLRRFERFNERMGGGWKLIGA